jgi:hypothetical protein
LEFAGAHAVFNGVDSPVTKSFGLGLFEELSAGNARLYRSFLLRSRDGGGA